jgi:hypothetical protein
VHEQSSNDMPEYATGDVTQQQDEELEAEDAGISAVKDIKHTAN